MILLERTSVLGWEHAIRGMRNPMNSWGISDTKSCVEMDCKNCPELMHLENGHIACSNKYGDHDPIPGPNDRELMLKLAKGGSVHAKYRRMITVYVDITAPLYWWKEFDTYKVGTVANSCSTMHKIHAKEFTLDDFSHEALIGQGVIPDHVDENPYDILGSVINCLNYCREQFLESNNKIWWWQMIQLLPTSYNQKRTIMMNYEVLAGLYPMRKDHKLDEWHTFCRWIENLPLSEVIIGENDENH